MTVEKGERGRKRQPDYCLGCLVLLTTIPQLSFVLFKAEVCGYELKMYRKSKEVGSTLLTSIRLSYLIKQLIKLNNLNKIARCPLSKCIWLSLRTYLKGIDDRLNVRLDSFMGKLRAG